MSCDTLTVPEVAEKLGISDRQVYRLIKQRRIVAKKMGRCLRIPVAPIDAWLASDLVEMPVIAGPASERTHALA